MPLKMRTTAVWHGRHQQTIMNRPPEKKVMGCRISPSGEKMVMMHELDESVQAKLLE
jgi:hypothetical protein